MRTGPLGIDHAERTFYNLLEFSTAYILTTFLGRIVRGIIEAFASTLALDELYYRLLLARVKDATGRHPLEVLHTDLAGAIATHGGVIDAALRKLMGLPHIHLVGVESADVS